MNPHRSTRARLFLCAFAVALLSTPAMARAQNRYAVVRLANPLRDITVYYWLQYEPGKEWREREEIGPGKSWRYHWKVDDGENVQPKSLKIKFATGIDRIRTYRTYNLQTYLSRSEEGGKRYEFVKKTDLDGEDYIDLIWDGEPPPAAAALESFELGSTLTPTALRALNELPGGEPIEDSSGDRAAAVTQLVASEKRRLEAQQFEMVAAADLLLRTARMSPAERAERQLKLSWLIGPVTAPNARGESKDGLAGLRVIGRLELPGGRLVNSIIGLKYYPARDPNSEEEGKVGLLSDADNFRLEVRLFKEGSTRSDYAFQSFAIAGQGDQMTMRPGFYVDERTGRLINRELVFTALGTACINCHLSGPKFSTEQLEQMDQRNFVAMGGYRDFLDQMRHWSASKSQRKRMAELLKAQGPAALLPLDDMWKANQAHWASIYPQYVAWLKQRER